MAAIYSIPLNSICRTLRYIAYWQLARWCWGYLGREVRVVLPSCAVSRIRAVLDSNCKACNLQQVTMAMCTNCIIIFIFSLCIETSAVLLYCIRSGGSFIIAAQ